LLAVLYGMAPSSPAAAKPAPDPKTPSQPAPAPTAPPARDAALPPEPTMGAEAALARATAFYEAGQYAQCVDAFASLLGDESTGSALGPRAKEQASVYRAACLIAQGDTSAADEVFRAAIRENPQMAVPNAIVFPPAVLERFIVVRTTMLEEIRREEEARAFRAREAAYQARRKAEAERERVAHLEELARQETIVVKNRRWLASVPFGVGQFQNRDSGLGVIFLTTELLAVATALTATSIELSLNAQAKGGQGILDKQEASQLNASLRAANSVALISTGAFILLSAGGILQANLAFVPEFRDGVRQRKAPPIVPSVAPVTGGVELGVVGRF
jgi:hypothetical protein